jgi:hypothetical protein
MAAALGAASLAQAEEIKLFNGTDLTGWTAFIDKKGVKPEEIWTVVDGVIRCKGKPTGYIRTDKEFSNYVLTLEWRFPEGSPGGNSGVLLHTVGDDKIWPKSIEAQLAHQNAGDIWLIDGATLDVDDAKTRRDGRRTKNLTDGSEKKIGKWNKYVIVCAGDTVTLVVNGDLVNYGRRASLNKGKICLQSEGAPIEFRNIVLRTLD